MQAYCLNTPGSIAGLVQTELPEPEIGPGDVLIRVRAASINNRDLMVVNDQYGFPIPSGLVPLSDAAGEVVATGAKVRRWVAGDRVSPAMQLGWIGGPPRPEFFGTDLGGSLPGVLAQFIAMPQEALVPLPGHLSFEEAATLNCAGVTAWTALHTPLPLTASDTVLVQGTGGVALFALQLAKAAGARVIALTSNADKAARLGSLGADAVIDYIAEPHWDTRVLEMTHGVGVDLVVETGGPTTIGRSVASLRIGGQLSLVGFSGGPGPAFDVLSLIGRALRVQSIAVGSRNDYAAMNRVIERHHIRPVVDRIFGFAEAREALEWLAARRHFGKIVIRVD